MPGVTAVSFAAPPAMASVVTASVVVAVTVMSSPPVRTVPLAIRAIVSVSTMDRATESPTPVLAAGVSKPPALAEVVVVAR